MTEALEGLGDLKQLAREYRYARDFLFLGRGTNYPIALEGALKLKEISYIHAEGYAAGEMKHGPDRAGRRRRAGGGAGAARARLREGAVEPGRGARAQRAHHRHRHQGRRAARVASATACCAIPDAPALLQPFLTVLPLQLMSYAIAVAKGNDVDQPRNLAKSVTVE